TCQDPSDHSVDVAVMVDGDDIRLGDRVVRPELLGLAPAVRPRRPTQHQRGVTLVVDEEPAFAGRQRDDRLTAHRALVTIMFVAPELLALLDVETVHGLLSAGDDLQLAAYRRGDRRVVADLVVTGGT